MISNTSDFSSLSRKIANEITIFFMGVHQQGEHILWICKHDRRMGILNPTSLHFPVHIPRYHFVDTGYCATSSSGVRMTIPWLIAWQISIRSNGSLCNAGSRLRCRTEFSSRTREFTMCCSLWIGTNFSGLSERGSFPSAYLTEISQTETTLRKTSLEGSRKSSRESFESSGASLTIQRNVQVSKRTLIRFCPQRNRLSRVGEVQKTQGEPETHPLPNLLGASFSCPGQSVGSPQWGYSACIK